MGAEEIRELGRVGEHVVSAAGDANVGAGLRPSPPGGVLDSFEALSSGDGKCGGEFAPADMSPLQCGGEESAERGEGADLDRPAIAMV